MNHCHSALSLSPRLFEVSLSGGEEILLQEGDCIPWPTDHRKSFHLREFS